MKINDLSIKVFFELLRAGLWEHEAWLLQFDSINYSKVYDMAQEQSVVGLIASGIEHVADKKIPKEVALMFVGDTLQLEQRNNAMNNFISMTINKMRQEGIYALLLKGQGIAQCYERPLWRVSGDVDLFLSRDNFEKAVSYFTPLATSIEKMDVYKLHMPLTITPWVVELHGTLRSGLWKRIDCVLDEIQSVIFYKGAVKSWMNGKTQVFLPRTDEDIFFVFSHILQHYFKGGVGLRQVCDWCRLLWTYRDFVNIKLLELRLKKARIMTEWKTFAALAVNTLGIPAEFMPFYDNSEKWQNKAQRVLGYMLENGNFGHNRDTSFRHESSVMKRKLQTFWYITVDCFKHFSVFPLDTIKVWWRLMKVGLRSLT